MTVPNQKTIRINKKKYKKDFLQIGVEEWESAYKELNGNSSSFALYLYLASNADGYLKELSCEAFKKATGRSKASYHRAVTALTEAGFIYEDSGGRLNFATEPKKGLRKAVQNWDSETSDLKLFDLKSEPTKTQICNDSESEMTIQIDNTEDIEDREIDNYLSSFEYLHERVFPTSEFITNDKKSLWLEDLIPDFWEMDPEKRVSEIVSVTDFNEEEAAFIVFSILDPKARSLAIRLKDFYTDGNYKEYY